ncbi:condensin complex subunit 1 [Klebsormidium nitens]|uniref:Condensin complex subunit 1 n=1 Tax=Klebsormidium nitens TaxID=105231 RepID=A0A1Y1I4J1_KLENI|nr:condensin complex subunit 1 [Klebsormidium nitens]|eukprot:GAQ85855.1 condensin complex subunit 1 [Klebsormidium nitens]
MELGSEPLSSMEWAKKVMEEMMDATVHSDGVAPGLSGHAIEALASIFGGQLTAGTMNGDGGVNEQDAPPVPSSQLSELWAGLAGSSGRLSQLVSGLRHPMEGGGPAGQGAAAAYLGMLLAPGCPLYSLFDTLTFLALLKCIQEASREEAKRDIGSRTGEMSKKKAGKRRGGTRDESEPCDASEPALDDVDTGGSATYAPNPGHAARLARRLVTGDLLVGLTKLLGKLPLADQPEARKVLIDTLAEAARGGAAGGGQRATEVAYAALLRLFELEHGVPLETGVAIMRAVTPSVLLAYESTGGTPDTEQRPARRGDEQGRTRAGVRARAIAFVSQDVLEWARAQDEQGGLDGSGQGAQADCPESPIAGPSEGGGQARTQAAPQQPRSTSGKAVRLAVAAMLRHLSLKAADLKADGRALAVDAIGCIAAQLDSGDLHKFAKFVLRLSRNAKVSLRHFAVDLAVGLLTQLADPFHHDSPLPAGSPPPPVPPPRCSDKAPQVRSRALTNLATAWDHAWAEPRHRPFLLDLLGLHPPREGPPQAAATPHWNPWGAVGRSPSPLPGDLSPAASTAQPGPGPSPLTPEAAYRSLGPLLRRRAGDGKAAVRRAALGLMEQLVRGAGSAPHLGARDGPPETPAQPPGGRGTPAGNKVGAFPTGADLAVMEAACSDPALSVRRAALGAISAVLRRWPGNAAVANAWAQAVLPMVADTEQSVQERCLDLFQKLVLDRVAQAGPTVAPPQGPARASGEPGVPREVITALGALSHRGGPAPACLTRLCGLLAKKGRLQPGVAAALQRVIIVAERWGTSRPQAPRGAWLLLAEAAAHTPGAVSWEFLQSRWRKLGESEDGSKGGETGRNYGTAGQERGGASASAAVEDRVCLLRTIVHVAACFPEDAAARLASALLAKLHNFALRPCDVGPHVDALVVLCARTPGGQAQLRHTAAGLLERAADLLAAHVRAGAGSERAAQPDGPPVPYTAPDSSAAVPSEATVETALFTVGALVQAASDGPPPPRLVTLVQSLVAAPSSGRAVPRVAAHAWVALGKLCLADERLAKRCMPLLVQELEGAASPAVRNNILVALADLCVRYTALVDSWVGRLAVCLRDACEVVRRQALLLLGSLLQREYVKWRGPLFHRVLRALVDDSPAVRRLAHCLFHDVLAAKAPLLAYTHFVEALSVLNDCPALHSDTVRAASQRERDLFSIKGLDAGAQAQRVVIYDALLAAMAPEHRFATTAKLCAEILGGVAEGALALPACAGVLLDALTVVASKAIRAGAKGRADADDDAPDDGAGGAAAAAAAAKGRLVSAVMKKNLMENVVPILIELKRVLEEARSPLLGPLMECIRSLLKEYKAELDDIFAADRQLGKEILYDIQKHEAAAKAAAAAARLATPATAATHRQGAPRTGGATPRGTPTTHRGAVSGRTVGRRPEQLTALESIRRTGGAGSAGAMGRTPTSLHGAPVPAQVGEGAGGATSAGRRDGGGAEPMASSPAGAAPPAAGQDEVAQPAAEHRDEEPSFEFQLPQLDVDPPTPQQTRRLAGLFDGLAADAGHVPEAGMPGRGGGLTEEASFENGGQTGSGARDTGWQPDPSSSTPVRPAASFAAAFLSPPLRPARTPLARSTLATPLPGGRPQLGTPAARTPAATPAPGPGSSGRSPTLGLVLQEGAAATPSLRTLSVPRLRPGASRWAERQARAAAPGEDGRAQRPAAERRAEGKAPKAGAGAERKGGGEAAEEQENRMPLPSPLPVRVYAPGAAEGGRPGGAAVLLFSPDQALPPLRQWNVQLPDSQETTKRPHRTPSKSPLGAPAASSPSPTAVRDLHSNRLRTGLAP